MHIRDIKAALRNGPYAWPGGYPLYFLTTEGEALSFAAVRKGWREVVRSNCDMVGGDSSWRIVGVDTNWEDPELFCAETNERIESAYAEPD
jgi:hypothetical protein